MAKVHGKFLGIAAALALAGTGIFLVLGRSEVEPLPPDVEQLLQEAILHDGPYKYDQIIRAAVEVGYVVGMDLPRLTGIARRVPAKYRDSFYDGAAHWIPWPVDNLPGCYEAIDRAIPSRYRHCLYSGPIIRLTRAHNGNPARVIPLLRDLPARAEPYIINGVRIGVLLEFIPDWKEAAAVILRYPREYHQAMFEEFGWWMGELLKTDVKQINELLADLPDDYRLRACEGYIRGLNLSGDRSAYDSVIAGLDPDYQAAAIAALNFECLEVIDR